MRSDDVELSTNCESWVREAVSEERYIDGGSFSVVYDAVLLGHVLKLTRSRAAYLALLELSGMSIHFPLVTNHAEAQGTAWGMPVYALLLEKLNVEDVSPQQHIADFILRSGARHRPYALAAAAEAIRSGGLSCYPKSLALALDMLYEYSCNHAPYVDLAEPSNWGSRIDGTLVMLDPVHSLLDVS